MTKQKQNLFSLTTVGPFRYIPGLVHQVLGLPAQVLDLVRAEITVCVEWQQVKRYLFI